jgi:phosphatidylserine decarboxylase
VIWDFLRTNLLWSEGYTLLLFFIGFIIFFYLLYRPLCYGICILFLLSFFFFRFPKRSCPECIYDMSVLVCPADGKVVDISFGDVGFGYTQKVSIYLSLFDAHVMWVPYEGEVQEIAYHPGSFYPGFLPKASAQNEHSDMFVAVRTGRHYMVRQIAGTLMRRISSWVNAGDAIQTGQPYGMIRFGSQVALYLPAQVTLEVGIGQKVVGGQTVLGRWSTNA